ncbi:MAG: 30S ribosomal protein S3, partial [Boseongicola sp.]
FKGEIMEHDPQARDRRQQELQDGPAPRGAGGGRRN